MGSYYDIFEVTADVDKPLSSDFNGFEINTIAYDMASVQIVWSGADETDAKIIPQVSNDGVNWCNYISTASSKTINEINGCCFYDFSIVTWKWMRMRIVVNSNTTGTFKTYYLFKRRRN